MQLTVAIKAKEVGIGWPWVMCTGELYLTYNERMLLYLRRPPPPPPSCKQAVKDDLLVGSFISEFCSMLTMVTGMSSSNACSPQMRVLYSGSHQSKSGAAHSSCKSDGKWNTIPPGWG